MKQIGFLLFVSYALPLWAYDGEVNIHIDNASSSIFTITQTSAFSWTMSNGTIVLASPLAFSSGRFSGSNDFFFNAPRSQGTNPTMPWGLMKFAITGGITFYIDFRDEDRMGPGGSSAYGDTYIKLDLEGACTIYNTANNLQQTIINNETINIWSFWNKGTPNTADFTIPVTLSNLVNTQNAGGTLHINSSSYTSGSTPPAPYNASSTYNIGTNNERFANYQGSGLTYKHNNWNNSSTDFKLTRNITLSSGTTRQDAYFVLVSPEALSNSLDGTVYTGSNGGYIPFVDPWYVDANGNQTGQPANITSGSSPTGAYGQSSGGVFLGQQIISGQPYYSLRAPVSQTINGHTCYFGGWSMSPSGSVTFQNAASATTAVVFNSSGATITANYIYATVTRNSTFQAATYNFAGTLTVNSGVTLTINSGAVLNFPAGASLIVNGAINANGVKFYFTQSYPYSGITINSNGSSLTNCTISGADQPIAINNTSSCTISADSIKNSNFNSSNGVLVNNSTPTITHLTIAGQSGSWSGMRYEGTGGGTLEFSTIMGCGAGHGIIIQSNSSPTIKYCTINNNYFYGIIINGSGTGNPHIINNSLSGNGTHGST